MAKDSDPSEVLRSIYAERLGEGEIRIARLEAGTSDDVVKCQLFSVKLDEAPKFQALSYEWKSQGGRSEIVCNDIFITVTSNLADAMHSIRHEVVDRLIWIDAICINQNDDVEKSRQVQFMTKIYASARSVIAWLGQDFDGVAAAFEVLPYLARLAVERYPSGGARFTPEKDYYALIMTKRPAKGSLLKSREPSIGSEYYREDAFASILPPCEHLDEEEMFHFEDSHAWLALERLFNNSYFVRTWIAQEVGVAREVFVQCGAHQVQWDLFHVAWEGRALILFKDFDASSNVIMLEGLRARYQSHVREKLETLDLKSILDALQNSQQVDARDRIYAARGLTRPSSLGASIIPDYSKPPSHVFLEAACHILHHRGDFSVWGVCTQKSLRSIAGLPSWVPEWTVSLSGKRWPRPESETLSKCMVNDFEIKQHALFVNAHFVDEVSKIFRVDVTKSLIDTIENLMNWLPSKGENLFTQYALPCKGSSRHVTDHSNSRYGAEEAEDLMRAYPNLPTQIKKTLVELIDALATLDPSQDGKTYIDRFWLPIRPSTYKIQQQNRMANHSLCLHLLIVAAEMQTSKDCGQMIHVVDEDTPLQYRKWTQVAEQLLETPNLREMVADILAWENLVRNIEGRAAEAFFTTKNGYFGRAPVNDVKPGLHVAIIGGAFAPMLLERHEDHFELVTDAYLEGTLDITKLGPDCKIERIELR